MRKDKRNELGFLFCLVDYKKVLLFASKVVAVVEPRLELLLLQQQQQDLYENRLYHLVFLV